MLTISDPKLRFLYDYWMEKRGARPFPSRGDLDPFDMQCIIGNVCLVDVTSGDPPRFRVRLQGSNLTRRLGRDWDGAIHDVTGRMLDELPPSDFWNQAIQSFTTVVQTGEPFHVKRIQILDGKPYSYDGIALPQSKDGKTVNMLLVGMVDANG
jgi:PAS domain